MQRIRSFVWDILGRFVLERSVQKNPLLQIQLWALRLFGYMIFEHQHLIVLHCMRGTVFTVSFVLFNVSQYVDLFYKIGDINEATNNAATTLLFTTCVFRMFNFYWNRTRYVNLVKAVDGDLKEILTTDDRRVHTIVQRSAQYTKVLTIAFWTCAMVTANTMCINSYVQSFFYVPTVVQQSDGTNATVSFPPVILKSWFPFADHWQSFSYVYWTQFYVMWLGMIIVPGQHVFVAGIMIFCVTALKILTQDLQELQSVADIVRAVERHRKIKRFVRELESLITHALFLDFVVFSVLLCALLFQTSKSELGVDTFINLCYITTMVIILWMYYWHANDIVYHSSALSDAAFHCQWFDNSRQFKRTLLMFMTCAQPMKMYAGFLPMSLDTFLGILRASYSYFTLLTQMDN